MNDKEMVRKQKAKQWGRELAELIVFALCVAFFCYFIAGFCYVPTGSMAPTIDPGDILFRSKCAYWFSEPEREDVIFFEGEDGKLLVKRVIGIEGDTIDFAQGKLLLNGAVVQEEYLREGERTIGFGTFQVPEGHYFVMGDNRMNSKDSRFFREPYIAKEDVRGKMILVIRTSKIKKLFATID